MRTFLIVAGAMWFTLAWLMLLSLALAARRRTPLPGTASFTPRQTISDPIPQTEVEVPATSTSDTTVVANYELEPRPLS
jgi:hypothetical protein